VSAGRIKLFARFGVDQRERHCPVCGSIVYTARHRLCGVCGQALPENCRFTDRESLNVEMLVQAERQRHRAWLRKATI